MTSDTQQTDAEDGKPDLSMIEPPPPTTFGMLMRIGPGLILVGSIVGSGELIATPATGATAGFYLLWLIMVGTVIKVLVQVEFGRFSICNGENSMTGMNELPGPRLGGANWLSWYWLIMFLTSLGQLGGIVGGVGQALAISWPLTEGGMKYNEEVDKRTRENLRLHTLRYEFEQSASETDKPAMREEIAKIEKQIAARNVVIKGFPDDAFIKWDANKNKLIEPSEMAGSDLAKVEKEKLEGARLENLTLAAAFDHLDANDDQLIQFEEFEKRSKPLEHANVDDRIWAVIVTIATSALLVFGQYGFIETASTILVASFTFMTVANLIMMQLSGSWAITAADIAKGLSFQLPDPAETHVSTTQALVIAFSTFGIIGVGANELIQYPSWCLEKGYARFTGPKDDSPEWAERANGWLNVMQWDVWCSLIVYTFATLAFYLLGAAVLGRLHLIPSGYDMMRTLSTMYEPVFGEWTRVLFLVGALAVLYSTFFAATAGHSRVCADAVHLFGKLKTTEESHLFWVRVFCGGLPYICLASYLIYPEPKMLVLFSGAMQGIMLPMLAAAALWFRYQRCDERVAPNRIWDFFLWLSAFGLLVSGSCTIYFAGVELVKMLTAK